MDIRWFQRLANFIEKHGGRRDIHRNVPGQGTVLYLSRFYLWKCKYFELMIHQFHIGDLGDLHDHPWPSFSWILQTGYTEYLPDGAYIRNPGYFGIRKATDCHRVRLWNGTGGNVWTIFGTGIRHRDWGFHTKSGFVNWRDYMIAEGVMVNSEPTQYTNGFLPKRIAA